MRLETIQLAFVKRGFHGIDFYIERASTDESLALYDSEREWSTSLRVRHNYSWDLIPIAEALKTPQES